MTTLYVAAALAAIAPSASAQGNAGTASDASALAFGETFTIQSRVLGETRRINVYAPPVRLPAFRKVFPPAPAPGG